MISLDQVLLLQEKVETAVSRIAALNGEVRQLKAENDALRTRCTELTNALSAKTELVSSLESDQDQIERSILNALNRLDTVENSILSGAAGSSPSFYQNEKAVEESVEADSEQEEISIPEIDVPVSGYQSDSESQPVPQAPQASASSTPAADTPSYGVFQAGYSNTPNFSNSNNSYSSNSSSTQSDNRDLEIF